jgi:hypothetical protein
VITWFVIFFKAFFFFNSKIRTDLVSFSAPLFHEGISRTLETLFKKKRGKEGKKMMKTFHAIQM